MKGPIRSFVPHAFVKDVRASIAFYEKLGFTVTNSFTPQGAEQPGWCLLSCERGELMLGTACDHFVAEQQGVLFYGYCDDVAASHAELEAAGLDVGPVTKPFYNPGGEFRLNDPDGYVIWVAQI
jgi:predicted enzyme related to lactoylglutathione lyase